MPPIEHASPGVGAMAGDKALRKYTRAAAVVRQQVIDGVLRPGQTAPSGAELSRLTGYAVLTCRRALRVLITEGVLVPGPSRNARPRVAGAAQPPGEQDLAAAGRALSAGLSARRRAARLTQPALAALAGVSVTTVGHAETGRLWQSRQFWERADSELGADGGLLRLHDAYRAAAAATLACNASTPADADMASPGPADAGPHPFLHPQLARPQLAPGSDPRAAGIPLPRGQAGPWPGESGPEWAPGAGPACVMIVWGDGTTTTVHPPRTAPSPGFPGDGQHAAGPAAPEQPGEGQPPVPLR